MDKKTAFLFVLLVVLGAYMLSGSVIAQQVTTLTQAEEQALIDQIKALLAANPGMTEDQAALQLAQTTTDPAQKSAILQVAYSLIQNPTQQQANAFNQAVQTLNLIDTTNNNPLLTFNLQPVQAQDAALAASSSVVASAPTPTSGTGGAGGGSN